MRLITFDTRRMRASVNCTQNETTIDYSSEICNKAGHEGLQNVMYFRW